MLDDTFSRDVAHVYFSLDATVSDTYYCTAVKHGGVEAWNTVYSLLQKENYVAERIRLLKALTCARERWLLGM